MPEPRSGVGKRRRKAARTESRNLRQEDLLDKTSLRKADGAVQGSTDTAVQEVWTYQGRSNKLLPCTLPLLRLPLHQRLGRLLDETPQPGLREKSRSPIFLFLNREFSLKNFPPKNKIKIRP